MDPILHIEKLADMVGSRYTLTVAAAKRARQLREGAIPLVKCRSNHPLTIALHEIAAGKVIVKELGEEADEYITDGRAEEPSDELSADSDLYDPDLLSIDSEDDIGAEDYEEAEDLDEDEE